MKKQLIDNALKLCGKSMEDMNIPRYLWDSVVNWMAFPEFWEEFSYPKFYAYLLSPEFIENYWNKYWDDVEWIAYPEDYYPVFWIAIGKYQKGNIEPIEDLLRKI